MGRLFGKIAIVTGAASGIGAAAAALFHAEGARILAVDRSAFTAPAEGPDFRALTLDLAEKDAPALVVGAVLETFGGLDILFNNAGVSLSSALEDTTDEDFDRVTAVNLRAVFRLSRAAAPLIRASGAGRIINTASVMAEGADYGLSAYCASKAGVVGLTRSMALELGRSGATVNAILPGAILTGMTREGFEDPAIAAVWAKKSVLKRLGAPVDVARVALFLASEDAGFVTGQALAVDGGMRLRI